jgi:hypothetical protein
MKLSEIKEQGLRESRRKILAEARTSLKNIDNSLNKMAEAGLELEWEAGQNISFGIDRFGDVMIDAPLDWPVINSLRAQIEAQGFQAIGAPFDTNIYARRVWTYGKPTRVGTCYLYLNAFEEREGATCKLVKVGERQTTEKVYEVVCNEGAAEHALG